MHVYDDLSTTHQWPFLLPDNTPGVTRANFIFLHSLTA